jgi:hypothetical protein
MCAPEVTDFGPFDCITLLLGKDTDRVGLAVDQSMVMITAMPFCPLFLLITLSVLRGSAEWLSLGCCSLTASQITAIPLQPTNPSSF